MGEVSLNGNELVLVVPAAALARLGVFAGLTTDVGRYMPRLLDPAGLTFRPRWEVETDASWLQLIPYVVLTHAGRVFHYTRGAAGGEARLHAKRSVGLGGHINPGDTAGGDPYRAGMRRELAEEVMIDTPFTERVLGLVHDPATPVGQVHLGIVHVLSLESDRVQVSDPALAGGGFDAIKNLVADREAFETWSRFVLDALSGRGHR